MKLRLFGHHGLILALIFSGDKKRALNTIALEVKRRLVHHKIRHRRTSQRWNRADQLEDHMSGRKLKNKQTKTRKK